MRSLERSVNTDNCASGPCHNGATCIDTTTEVGFTCICPQGFQGISCSEDVNECFEFIGTPFGCQVIQAKNFNGPYASPYFNKGGV